MSEEIAKKIAVIEDNNFVRMQIVKFLQDDGFECVQYDRADKALDEFDESFSAAVVDVRMEPIDGFDFIAAIRARDLGTPVVLVTGDDNPDLLSEANRLGVAAVLMKPVQKERLVKMVARMTKRS